MQIRTKFLPGAAWSLALSLFAASGLAAQARVLLPEGSVIIVRTATALQSNNVQVGQSFSTVVVDTISADEYTVIPAGSRIRGVISFVQPATRQQSGVIEVAFDRLTRLGALATASPIALVTLIGSQDRKSTRLNSSHTSVSRMPSSA